MKSPKVALMQPTFMPWQGYFALVGNADIFVFLDDFQFSRRSFDQRNRIFVAKEKAAWVTVPVEHSGSQDVAFCEVRPLLAEKFRDKFLAQLKFSYTPTPYFKEIFPAIEKWIAADWPDLASLSMAFIQKVSQWFGYAPQFMKSSDIPSEGKRSLRLAKILESVEAKTYLSARGSFEYMLDDGVFPLESVATCFQKFDPAPYPQKQSAEFISHLSVLDALFQVGPEQTRAVIEKGQKAFVPWDDMISGK